MIKNFALMAAMTMWGVSAWAENHTTDGPAEAEGSGETDTVTTTQDVDLEQAEKIYQRNCRACHGNKAQGVASYPKLSDKDPEYIAEKLKIYRSGERIGPNSVLMIQNARELSDEDIASLSVYVATAFD